MWKTILMQPSQYLPLNLATRNVRGLGYYPGIGPYKHLKPSFICYSPSRIALLLSESAILASLVLPLSPSSLH